MSPSAVEAFGAAACGGHFAEEPGAGGMQMRQTQGGERRSPEETGGRALGRRDGCLPRGREEGGSEEHEAVGAAFWVRLGPAWRLGCTRGVGAMAHPPTAATSSTSSVSVPELPPGHGCDPLCKQALNE